MDNIPAGLLQNAAGTVCSGGSGSQDRQSLLTQRQRTPGPAAAQAAGSGNARQDGGV